jgi:hypothetical protein
MDAAMRQNRRSPMTTFRTPTIARIASAVAIAVTLSATFATPSYAFSSEAQQMCTGDAFRLCSSEIPNIPKITACMRQNRTNLSTGCRAVMDRDDAAAKGNKVAAN